jgi:hypothetical protein
MTQVSYFFRELVSVSPSKAQIPQVKQISKMLNITTLWEVSYLLDLVHAEP